MAWADVVPTVSIVMSVYNDPDGFVQAYNSIQAQTLSDYEFIVINDGSTDERTGWLISEYAAAQWRDGRMRGWDNHHNLGLATSLNVGVEMSRSPLIARQDSGDLSHPERLARQVAFMQAHPEVVLLGTGGRMVDSRGQVIAPILRQHDDAALRQALREDNAFTHGSVVFRKEAFQRVGGYDECFPASQDYDLFVRLADVGQVANLPDALYDWRFDPRSTTFARFRKQYAYRQVVRLRQHDPFTAPNIPALMAQAPVLAERLWWLAQLAGIDSPDAHVVQMALAQDQPEWQDRPVLLPYAVKYGLKLADKHHDWDAVLRWLSLLYPANPAWQGRALRRIAARATIPLSSQARALLWQGWQSDWRGWGKLLKQLIHR
ncbi:MAG: glycosyltransferase [Anaerolineae bacterium]|nr:glycosyltransferase [Anaerolineae bacterium]MDW8171602.1 glycosyltransferase [Anaerolineae bacterium]